MAEERNTSAGIELYKKNPRYHSDWGNIGKRRWRRRAFGASVMTVLAYDPPFAPMDFIVEITTKERLARGSGLHLPLTPRAPSTKVRGVPATRPAGDRPE